MRRGGANRRRHQTTGERMTAPELMKCPFCGGGAEDDYMHDDDQCGGHGAVYCVEGCGAEVYGDTVRYRGQEPTKEAMQASKQSAIAAWNTRTPDPLKYAVMKS